MPVYNASNYLNLSINSLLNQSLKDIELICVDDGSTDNSLEILKDFSDKHDFIKIITQKNSGSGIARNKGLDNASGEYIAFLDADDIFIDKDALEVMYKTAVKYDADLVCGNLKRHTNDGRIVEDIHKSRKTYAFFDDYGFISSEDYGVPWAFYKNIFKRDFLNKNNIRFPDLKRGQDPVFMAEVLVSTDNIPVTPKILYGYSFEVDGGPRNKVDNFDKKKDYITHFKMTFDILENSGLNNLSEKYKENFFSFINHKEFDLDLYNIVIDLFGFNSPYFENYTDEYMLFKVKNILNIADMDDSDDSFEKIKNELLNMDISTNELINKEMINTVDILCKSEDNIHYKLNLYSFKINELKRQNQKLKDENIELKKLNNQILNSSSWKITGPLRNFKHLFSKKNSR